MAGEETALTGGETGILGSNNEGEHPGNLAQNKKGEEESDEEGEIKEAGSDMKEGTGQMRDLREEIEAKRGRRRPQMAVDMDRREPERGPQPEPFFNHDRRRGYEEDHAMMNGGNNGHMGHEMGMRREDLRREPHPRGGYEPEFDRDFRRGSMGGYDEMRRRPPSPFRPREPMMMRRGSPPLRRMSPPPMRRFPPNDRFNPEFRDPREFDGRGMMMEPRDRERDFMPEHSPRFAPGRERDMGPRERDLGAFPPPERSPRTCGIRISNLPHPHDVSGERLRADLLDEASMHGRVVEFQLGDRDAFVTYVEPAMAESARRQMHRTVMHNTMLEVELDLSAPLPRGGDPGMLAGGKEAPAIRRKPELFDEMDDPMATCRISVDELGEGVGEAEVAAVFKAFGFIDSLVIRRVRGQPQAEMKFRSLASAVRAKREMDGRRIWQAKSRVDYCMGPASCELWLGSVHGSITEQLLGSELGRFGKVTEVRLHRNSKCAYVAFERAGEAAEAAEAMRGRTVGNSTWRLKVDFWERSDGPRDAQAPRFGERRMSNPGPGGGERAERAERHERGGGGGAGGAGESAVTVRLRRQVSDKALATHLMAYGQVQAMERAGDGATAVVRFARAEEAAKALRDAGAAAVREELGIEVVEVGARGGGGAGAHEAAKRGREGAGGEEWDGGRKRLHVEVPPRERGGGATPQSFTPTPTGRSGWGGFSEPLTTQGRAASGGSTPLSLPQMPERKVASGGSTPTARGQSQPLEGPGGAVAAGASGAAGGGGGGGGDAQLPPRPAKRSDSSMSMEVDAEASARSAGGEGEGPAKAGEHARVEGEGGRAVPRNGEQRAEEKGMEVEGPPAAAKEEAGGGLARYPVVWPGAVAIKGAAVAIRLHGLGGEGTSLVSLLPAGKVTVTRRMKLEADQMKDFTATLNSWKKENFAMLLATPGEPGGSKVQFESQLVRYLTERNAAGVVQLEGSAMMYMFPPGELAVGYLQQSVPDLDAGSLDTYLLVVLAKG